MKKKDEDTYNKSNEQVRSGHKRKWEKSKRIKDTSRSLKNKFVLNNTLDIRFYEFPPHSKGYIFDDKEAYIGEYEWQKNPLNGGSQYKGSGKPLTYYTDETELGKEKIKILISRFEHLWECSKTYEQIELEESKIG